MPWEAGLGLLVSSNCREKQTESSLKIFFYLQVTCYSPVHVLYSHERNMFPWTKLHKEKFWTKETRFKLTQVGNLNEQTNSSDV